MDSFSCMFFLELLHLNFNMHYFINNTLKYLHFRSRNVRLGSPIYDNDVETFGGKCQKDTDIMYDTPWCKTTFSCTGQSHGNYLDSGMDPKIAKFYLMLPPVQSARTFQPHYRN